MEILGGDARQLYREAGADVDESSMRVRFDRGLIEEAMATVPPEFTLHSRIAERSITLGGNHIVTTAVSTLRTFSDLDNGRRPRFEDFRNLVRVPPVSTPTLLRRLSRRAHRSAGAHQHLDCYMTFIPRPTVSGTYALVPNAA